MRTTKSRLAVGVAGIALATGLAVPVQAACTIDGTIVTCSADSTAIEVNAAMASVAGSDVTLRIVADADVIQPGTQVTPTQQGAVAVSNVGDVGETAARIDLTYIGTADAATNTFDLANPGRISGQVTVTNVGGTTSISNSGLIGNGLIVSTTGSGAVTIDSSGTIDADGPTGLFVFTRGNGEATVTGNVGTVATATETSDLKDVQVFSQQAVTPVSVVTVTTDGTATTTTTTNAPFSIGREGSAATITIGEGGNTGLVTAAGLSSAVVVVDGNVGSSTDFQAASAFSSTIDQRRTLVSTVDGADSSSSDTTVRTAIGGTAEVRVGQTGTVSGNLNANGLTSASIVVNGAVGSEDAVAGAFATSNNFDETTISTNGVDGVVSSSTFRRDTTQAGGAATIAIGETGVVTGGINANGTGGAAITIDGSVGLDDAPSFANATSNGAATTFAQQSSFNSDTGSNTFAQQQSSQAVGGDATISVGEDGALNGGASANANDDAAVTNAGFIRGGVFATSSGTDSSFDRVISDDGAGNESDATTSQSTTTGGTATIVNADGALIGLSATSPVSVSASGDTAASVSNAGRINGSVSVESSGLDTENTSLSASTFAIDATTSAQTSTTTNNSEQMQTNLGGDASFVNAEGGLVTGSVNVNGLGSATVANNGAVIGTTFAQSSFDDSVNVQSNTSRTVFVPGAEGSFTTSDSNTNTFSRNSTGGDVSGTYAGSNGALQFAPFGGASNGSVTQIADGDSSAIVTGAIFGSFSGSAAGDEFTQQTNSGSTEVYDADFDLRSSSDSSSFEQSFRNSDSASTLAVNGGTITGSASLFGSGSANAQLGDEAEIGGSLTVSAGTSGGNDFSQAQESSFLYDADGDFTGGEETFSSSSQSLANSGNVSVTIGEARVGGNVSINGAAGSNTFSLAENGAVGGSVFQTSNFNTSASEQSTTTISSPTGSTQTTEFVQTQTASGGDVASTVAGTIGLSGGDPLEYSDVFSAGGNSLSLFTNAGDASATVTGQIRNGISVRTSGSDTTFASQQARTNFSTTAYSEQQSSTATGGTAILVVDASETDVPANFGNITVVGRGGSSVTIGADSTVLAATNGASMQVGGNYSDTTSTRDDTYTGTTLTGQTLTSSSTVVGGAATLVNDGRIGFDGGAGFDGANAFVQVISPTAAVATNNGAVYGSLSVRSLHTNVSSATTRTDINDVTRVDTTDRIYAAGGGTATLTNNGLVTGSAFMAAIDGSVTNDGVLRGNLALGGSVANYTTRTVNTLTQFGQEEVIDLAEAIAQGYAVAQNGLLGGSISVSGAFVQIGDDEVRTSDITADIDLNSGSVTGGGVFAEYDDESGERFTSTTVNLNGAGYLGLGDTAIAALEDEFGDVDPQIALAGDLSAYSGGARVLGVDALNKTGSGVFLITGADFSPASNTNRVADYTLDLGTFTIGGGEIQLDTATDEGVFGVRGNVVNNAGLVLGNRVMLPAPLFGTNATVTAIDGVEVYQQGNFTQSGTGTLTVGITPTLVRVTDPAFSSIGFSANPLAVQQIGLASGLFTTPDRAFGQAFADLGTGFLTLDGNLDLDGTVQLLSPTGGLFTDGQRVDIASVSGTVTADADVTINGRSNFVTFDLATRSEGGWTVVFATADRAGFETVATNQNASAAGAALSAALPGVVSTIQAGSAGGIGLSGNQFVLAQDLANIFAVFDGLATTAQVAEALNELASGEFYGSLTNLSTTAPFVDAITTRRLPSGATGFNLWFAPSGDFIELEGDDAVGSFDVDADNYGASMGFGVATGNGELGIGFGYGRIDATSRGDLLHAEAETWMIGAYARQEFGPLAVGAQLVYGWSDWDTSRIMPVMSREASGEFDSTELRGTLHAEYTIDLGGGWIAPFGQLEFRRFDFDGFTEEGAGAVNLVVGEAEETVLTPTAGLKAGTRFQTGMAILRPEITVAYSFAGDSDSFRDVTYLGAPGNSFRLQGIQPDNHLTIGAGLYADIGRHSGAFLRGSYTTSGNIKAAAVSAGVAIGF